MAILLKRETLTLYFAMLIAVSGVFAFVAVSSPHPSKTQTTSASSVSSNTSNSTKTADGTCVAPPPPVQVLSQLGAPPFTFVGADTACAAVIPSASGSDSLANFALTLDATKPLRMTMVIDINDGGTSSVPNGTTFTANDGTQNFTVYDDLHPAQTPATVIAIPGGETTLYFQVSVPNPYKAGTYFFSVSIFASSESNGSQEVWSASVPVNLDTQ